jgi:hypothetical protein
MEYYICSGLGKSESCLEHPDCRHRVRHTRVEDCRTPYCSLIMRRVSCKRDYDFKDLMEKAIRRKNGNSRG